MLHPLMPSIVFVVTCCTFCPASLELKSNKCPAEHLLGNVHMARTSGHFQGVMPWFSCGLGGGVEKSIERMVRMRTSGSSDVL